MLFEREVELAILTAHLDGLASSGGRVVLVRGEAGIGKSSLVTTFVGSQQASAHILIGTSDNLLTPQPFGAIWDLARDEPSLLTALEQDEPRLVHDELLSLLSRSLRPTVIVLEDTQWADEATLDAIKFVGRRIGRTNGLLILTYRDGEIDEDHPLRQVIGDLPPSNMSRLQLKPLSPAAVEAMIGTKQFTTSDVLALTDGNPLFVTEVLGSGTETVPRSIHDTVMARASRLSPAARALLDLISIAPGGIDQSVLSTVLEDVGPSVTECERNGLVTVQGTNVACSHELQRRAVEATLSSDGRQNLNELLLDALMESADASRLVHHAREARNSAAVVRFAPVAARAAMNIESHREAVEYFRTLEPFLDEIDIEDRAQILTDWGIEESLVDSPDAVLILDRAIALHRLTLREDRLSATLTFASRINRNFNRNNEAVSYIEEAIEILQKSGDSTELANALSARTFNTWLYTEDIEKSLKLADEALRVARATNGVEATISVLNTKGGIVHSTGDLAGYELVEEARRLAEEEGHKELELRALTNLAAMSGDVREVARGSDFAKRAAESAERYDMPSYRTYAKALLSEFMFWAGDWEAAENTAADALGSNPHTEHLAWRILGVVQTREGRPGAKDSLQTMWDLAGASDQLTLTDPATTALAEYMWITGDIDEGWLRACDEVFQVGLRAGEPWPSGAFAFWMWKLGRIEATPPGSAQFYGSIIDGEPGEAADFWSARQIPYEHGLALLHGSAAEQAEAVHIFENLGARATAARARSELADLGVKVARGQSSTTKSHAAGLTARQAEVLECLADGLTNVEIADKLFVSPRTVDNHVAAILIKLDAANRSEAVVAASDQALLDGAG